MKIPAPNYTQSPNILFDEVFKTLKEGELRVILVIIRQTFGWHKPADRISITQLATKTGMETKSVCRSLNSLIEKGLVEKKKFGEKGKERCYYSLVIEESEDDKHEKDDISEEEMELISNSLYQCPKDTPPVSKRQGGSVSQTLTKETNTKETNTKEQLHAAAVFSQSSEKMLYHEEIYPILKDIDIPEHDKYEISRRFKPQEVEHAIKWAMHPTTKLNKSLCAAIKWACQNQPSLPIEKVNVEAANKEYAKKYDMNKSGITQITVCNEYVEFEWGGINGYLAIKYSDIAFMEVFKSMLRKHNFKILD